MDDRTLLTTGIAGAVVAALCCATPVFMIVLGAVGFSAWVGLVGYVLIPALAVCIGLTIYALRRHRAEIDGVPIGVVERTHWIQRKLARIDEQLAHAARPDARGNIKVKS